MMRIAFALALLPCLAQGVSAAGGEFAQVRDKGTFLDLVDGRQLRIGLCNLSL